MAVTYVDLSNPNDVDQRIDNFLMRTLKGVPRQHVYKILRSGEVRVNGGRIKAHYRLKLGDRIRIPPTRLRAASEPRLAEGLAQRLRASVLHEDAHLLVINKPAGIAVHGGSSLRTGIVETLRASLELPDLALAHRLDRGTSGCLVLAKKRAALRLVQAAFRDRRVKKIYDLYVWGKWPQRQRTVQFKLKRVEAAHGERRVRVDAEGQLARTDFRIVERGRVADSAAAPAANITHLSASLHTGRTHQIRVHASAIGCPVVGDDKYMGSLPREAVKAFAAQEFGASPVRLCLHASRLVLPYGDDTLKLEAPIPTEMAALWRGLTGEPAAS